MTLWRENVDIEYLTDKLGKEVYNFLTAKNENLDYLYDHFHMFTQVKKSAEKWQLSDYSPFVLHICKFFENSLILIIERLGLSRISKKDWEQLSIRGFSSKHRDKITSSIESEISNKSHVNKICDKLFSTIEDFEQRNKIAHPGKLLKYAEIDNYDSFLPKLRELVEILAKYGLLEMKISK